MTQGWNATASGTAASVNAAGTGVASTSAFNSATSTGRSAAQSAYEGKASYEWAGDVAGKIWTSAISQKVSGMSAGGADRATAMDIGANVNVAGFGLTGYYGQGSGIGQTGLLRDGFDANGKSRDSDQWYVQGTYTIPGLGTKLGLSYGESTLDGNASDKAAVAGGFKELKDSMWTVGAYHPLTKHLNLVAEYSRTERELDRRAQSSLSAKAQTVSLGAILFF